MVRIVAPIKQHLQDPLYKNAYFLMVREAATAVLGLVFWIVVARFYPPDEVGLAVALISAMGLLIVFSKLGLGFGLMRYLATAADKKGTINTCLTISGLFSFLLAIIFVAGLGFWSPALVFVQRDSAILLLFIILAPIYSILTLQGNAFVGMRSAKFSFTQATILSTLRIPLPIALVSFGVLGIFCSWGISLCVALIIASFLFLPRVVAEYYPAPTIKKTIVNEMMHFSAGNYVIEIFEWAPGFLLPVIVINVMSAKMSAYFYMAWAIAVLLFSIPRSITTSLLAEGSHNPDRFRRDVIRAIKFTMILIIPAIVGILILGDKLLFLFGSEYFQNGLRLLWILALSGIPVAITAGYATVKRVHLKISFIIPLFAFIAIGTLGLSYILMVNMGLLGIGIAWIAIQIIAAAAVGWLVIRKEKWLTA